MPPAPKRRRTTSGQAASATKASQSTLSFRSSKAGARAPTSGKKANEASTPPAQQAPQTVDVDVDVNSDDDEVKEELQVPAIYIEDPSARILQSPTAADGETGQEVEAEEEEEEEAEQAALDARALALPEAKIKSYWTGKERERKAPRVHQEGLSVREKVLREFDMSSRYGPSIGIPRLGRWRRAHNLGMDPPVEVLAVLLKEEQQQHAKGGRQGQQQGAGTAMQRSIMDELIMSSRLRDGLAEAT